MTLQFLTDYEQKSPLVSSKCLLAYVKCLDMGVENVGDTTNEEHVLEFGSE